MTKKLVCPKCGKYQDDTTNVRKAGVAAKKAGLFAGHHAVKMGTKMLASAVGLDDDYSQRAAGVAGKEIANAMGLNHENVSFSDVTYKCSFCSHCWTGQDNPAGFNSLQSATVEAHRRAEIQNCKAKLASAVKHSLVALLGVGLSLWIWSARQTTDVTSSFLGFTSTSTSYSWHYYVFWPLVVVSAVMLVAGLIDVHTHRKFCQDMESKSIVAYARENMQLGAG